MLSITEKQYRRYQELCRKGIRKFNLFASHILTTDEFKESGINVKELARDFEITDFLEDKEVKEFRNLKGLVIESYTNKELIV